MHKQTQRRKILKWSIPVLSTVALPSHAQCSGNPTTDPQSQLEDLVCNLDPVTENPQEQMQP